MNISLSGLAKAGTVLLGFLVLYAAIRSDSPLKPGSSAWNRKKCLQDLSNIRSILLEGERNTGVSFQQWLADSQPELAGRSLPAQVCEYCSEYADRVGVAMFEKRKIDGEERLVDPWGNHTIWVRWMCFLRLPGGICAISRS